MSSTSDSATTARVDEARQDESLRLPLILLGVGLGGFVDGIVLHQLLQWHHMLSNTHRGRLTTVAGLEANTLADGVFHAFAFIVVVTAWCLLMRIRQTDATVLFPSSRVMTGWLLTGWG